MVTWRFYQNLYHTNSIQDKRKHRKCKHFFQLQQMLKMSSGQPSRTLLTSF